MYGGNQPPFHPNGGNQPPFYPNGGVGIPPFHINPHVFQNPNFVLHHQPNASYYHQFPPNPSNFHSIQQRIPIQPTVDQGSAFNHAIASKTDGKFTPLKKQVKAASPSETIEKVDKAVRRIHREILDSNGNVSAWKVSEAALLAVKSDSWESLGFQMQQVPSLNRIIMTEGKVNAFIHCFVAVRRITSLHDLEGAICENEGIEKFEKLELGPLLRHPLVVHYFSIASDVKEVHKLRTEKIFSYLCEFMDTAKKKELKIDAFLRFISKNESVSGPEKLSVRIQNFGMWISHIRKTKQSEDAVLEKCYDDMKIKSAKMKKRRPLFSAQKKQMDDHFTEISRRMKSFSSENVHFSGGHVKFVSSSSEDDSSDTNECENFQNENNNYSSCSSPMKIPKSDRISCCPYPSATEEMTRLGLKSEVESGIDGKKSCSADDDLPRKNWKCQNNYPSSSENVQFSGKHIRFVSSSSEDDDNHGNECENLRNENNDGSCSSPMKITKSDRVSSCPYPSVTEEMTRLGLKNEVECGISMIDGKKCYSADNELPRKKRKSQNHPSPPRKLPKKDISSNLERKSCGNEDLSCQPVSDESLRMFLATWKEACRENTADEVLERMLLFYDTKKRKKVKRLFTSYPFVGLLYAAVTCIKYGMLDNLYETFQSFSKHGKDSKEIESSTDFISINVELDKKNRDDSGRRTSTEKHDITNEDIIKAIAEYFEEHTLVNNLAREDKFHVLWKLCKCEHWLVERYSIDKFESLGYGDYIHFLDKYRDLLPHTLPNYMSQDMHENASLEAHLLPIQLHTLLSQAFSSLWENKTVIVKDISELLERQFPLVSFKVREDIMPKFSDILLKIRGNGSSSCVLFSTPLLKLRSSSDSLVDNEKDIKEIGHLACIAATTEGMSYTTKNAIEVLLKAPMLTDLHIWSHWDLFFAPSLGSMLEWLLKEVNKKELLCLVTKDGKVIRVNHSASLDSFSKAFVQGSSYETAVELLSLFASYGGERNAPLALLKCHARKAFEMMINSYLETESDNDKNPIMIDKPSCDQLTFGDATFVPSGSNIYHSKKLNEAAPMMSRFILDCLGYIPIEFCSFAADVLIAGLKPFVKDVPSAILGVCNQIGQRLMLHDVGISLGIIEWINDYSGFCSSLGDGSSGSSLFNMGNSKLIAGPKISKDVPDTYISSGEGVVTQADHHQVVSSDFKDLPAAKSELLTLTNDLSDDDPNKIIESIRQEEFGLDPHLSATDNVILEKQHARLGRALHCLSQELYSEDSHFLLELVQNADDNTYADNVEPTLVFILQENGIVVLNNEQGFNARDIRALCDVGNSTKKGTAGYIGKKGIGFKSVFRVTDAPEIHSKGFHIKFDITKGQIGFILPTVIPPCDIGLYARLASADDDLTHQNSWNTCIQLPFRSTFSKNLSISNREPMLSDLSPSLLLFLHRLQCIKIKNAVDGSHIVMRKNVKGDGIIEVTQGDDKMTWFVLSQKVQVDVIHSNAETTEISVAFALQEKADGQYMPILNQQPVFAFLPLRTYGLKFILQGDFVLPSSREEVDGNSPWNQQLLSAFPDLFVSALRSFCNLPCYTGNTGKAISVFMNCIPLVGDVHGFFASLPIKITQKLRMSNCFILEDNEREWVAPSQVLRNWNEQTRSLLSDTLLREHVGLGFLNKDIVLSDSLARALGVTDFGPKILLEVISSLCHSENGLAAMGLSWLSSCLSAIYVMLSRSFVQKFPSVETEADIVDALRGYRFVPLSDGNYASLKEGTIWLHSEGVGVGINDEDLLKAFPKLFAKLRIVSPNFLCAAASVQSSSSYSTIVEDVTRMLYKVGVQQLSAHDIVKVQVLPNISDHKNAVVQEELMIEYLAFAMFHLQSSCTMCSTEKDGIIAELREKALILTNYGFKIPNELPIHFNREYGNRVLVDKLISGLNMKWHEIDSGYVRHPITKSISGGVSNWRSFFEELGVTDFVKVTRVGKNVLNESIHSFEDNLSFKDTVTDEAVAENWESEELFQLLSGISSRGDREKSKLLLEILDNIWDDYFSNKVSGYCFESTGEGDRRSFKFSVIDILRNSPWIMSSINEELHCPKDLFHDCGMVNSVLGVSAPYAIAKVRSEKFLSAIGLKTEVTLDDALYVLKIWRTKSSLRASLSQMSHFYTFLWNKMAHEKEKVVEELLSGPFIFVPNVSSFSLEDVVSGQLLSLDQVYWHEAINSINQIKLLHPEYLESTASGLNRKVLCSFYPNLQNFFVNECGVDERLPFCSYLQILLQLSTVTLPHQAAKTVFEVLLSWADAIKSGLLHSLDIEYLQESLQKKEYAVLPTRHDKWVSLHPSFGVICWCDDDSLGREFRHVAGIDFLRFGGSTDESDEDHMLQSKVSTVMQELRVPALSEVVTREPICYDQVDCSSMYSLVNWILPYAQRYMYHTHPDKYFLLKQPGFEILSRLQIVVVEKLFYRNVIKKTEIISKKMHECSCLLQDSIFYCSSGSDPHSIFLELSSLLYNGTPELHFANFLHMITTMAESGATEEQTEFFIMNSQKVAKLPAEESNWSLPSVTPSSLKGKAAALSEYNLKEHNNSSTTQRKLALHSNWPPADWKTAPGFSPFSTKIGSDKMGPSGLQSREHKEPEKTNVAPLTEIDGEINIELDPTYATVSFDTQRLELQSNDLSSYYLPPKLNAPFDPVDDDDMPTCINSFGPSSSAERDSVMGQQALVTGRLGELVAYKYFVGEVGEGLVKWVNEVNETGLPYDILLGDDESSREYIEVKATKSGRKNWFLISMREWQFAIEKGESFSIAHVTLAYDNVAKVTIYKNPARLCQLGNLKLAMVIPKK